MTEAATVDAGLTTLVIDDADGLQVPDRLCAFDGSIVVRTPTSTTVRHQNGTVLGPKLVSIVPSYFECDGELHNPALAPDKVSFKPFGEPAEVFQVDD